MKNEIFIDGDSHEVRIACMENERLEDFFVERSNDAAKCAGNIYKGVVSSIVPGIQAAFVNIGLEKNGFLYVGDVVSPDKQAELQDNDLSDEEELISPKRSRDNQNNNIRTLLKEGQEILVQVTKDPIGTKGPRLTCYVSIPGRYMVYMPTVKHRGVSRKIAHGKERARLREIVHALSPQRDCGLIVRTAGISKMQKDFERDLKYLESLWHDIAEGMTSSTAPALLHSEHDLLTRILRDFLREDTQRIFVESKEHFQKARSFLSKFAKGTSVKLLQHQKDMPLFEAYQIEKEIEKLYRRKVWLKCGGYIIIEQTEALISIDVNTGRNIGKTDDLEKTVVNTNLESAMEIPRQLRLRNLGGIIIIDFIDMDKRKHRDQVYDALDKALRRDRAKTKIYQISKLGLVEMSRQRVSDSLQSIMFEDCVHCSGEGTVKSPMTLCIEMVRSVRNHFCNRHLTRVVINLHPETKAYFMKHFGQDLSQLCAHFKKEVELKENLDLYRDEVKINTQDKKIIHKKGDA